MPAYPKYYKTPKANNLGYKPAIEFSSSRKFQKDFSKWDTYFEYAVAMPDDLFDAGDRKIEEEILTFINECYQSECTLMEIADDPFSKRMQRALQQYSAFLAAAASTNNVVQSFMNAVRNYVGQFQSFQSLKSVAPLAIRFYNNYHSELGGYLDTPHNNQYFSAALADKDTTSNLESISQDRYSKPLPVQIPDDTNSDLAAILAANPRVLDALRKHGLILTNKKGGGVVNNRVAAPMPALEGFDGGMKFSGGPAIGRATFMKRE